VPACGCARPGARGRAVFKTDTSEPRTFFAAARGKPVASHRRENTKWFSNTPTTFTSSPEIGPKTECAAWHPEKVLSELNEARESLWALR